MSIFQQPVGTSSNPVFDVQDLLDIEQEFGTTHVYFASSQHDVICQPLRPGSAMDVCSTKATGVYEPIPGWTTIQYVPPVLHRPEPAAVPEPNVVWVVMLLLAIWILWPKKWDRR